MKIIKKITALVLVVLMIMATAGCSTKAEWSFKTDNKELAVGVYIYSLYSAYSEAANLASELEDYNSEESFLNLEIQGEDDDAPMKAEQWIVERAKKICRTMLAVEDDAKTYDIKISSDILSSIDAAAESDWTLGPNYQYYAALGYASTPYESLLYPLGVSFDSFKYSYYIANQLQYELFCKLYKEGGDKAVSDEELKEFFYDNYTSYKYFTVSLTNTEEDEDGNSSAVAMTDSEKKAIKKQIQAYIDDVNSGEKTWDDIRAEYMEDKELESDPSYANTEVLENSTVSDEVKELLADLAEGKADMVEVGSDTSAVLYVVYKTPLADVEEDNLGTDDAAEAVLIQYKSDEYAEYLEEKAAAMSISENTSVINKYKPKMFEE